MPDPTVRPAHRDESDEISGVITDSSVADASDVPAEDGSVTAGRRPWAGIRWRRPADEDRTERVFGVGNVRVWFEALGVAVICWALSAIMFRLWNAPLHLPVTYINGDLNQSEQFVKTIIQTGWWTTQPHLGAPFVQQNYDFPQGGEAIQTLVVRFMALFTSSPGLITNVYYFGGFGVVAATAFLVLRHLRFGPFISAAVSVPYAFLPFRFFHNEAHLFRTTYISVPLACLLLIWLAGWRQRFLRDPSLAPAIDWRHNLRWKRVIAGIVLCLFVGSWETMTTAFTLVLMSVLAIVGAIRWHEWRRLVVGLCGVALIGLSFGLSSAQALLYWHAHGHNLVAGKRIVAEAELYGLKLNRLLLPSDGSRLHFLQVIANKSQAQTPVISEGGQSIGILFTLGVFGALYAAVAGVRRMRTNGEPDVRRPEDREALRETIGLTVVTAIVVATVGGFSTIFGLAGFTQVRSWNRISLFIAFFALLQVVIWGERLARWARGRWRWTPPILIAGAIAASVLTIALGPPVVHPAYSTIVAQSTNDRNMVSAVEKVMPAGSNVMQVPTIPYPEAFPPGKIEDYDPLRPFLADDKGALNWSYGAMKGRPEADWQPRVTNQTVVSDLPALLGMGFTGLWVDTYGYTKASAIPGQIQRAIGEKPIVSQDGRFQFYDLRPYKARLGKTDAQLRALAIATFGITPPSS